MNFNSLRYDIPAGVVVFLVALPLSLGISQASGLPPFVGLMTGVIGGIVVTFLSPSRFAVSGPAAGLVTIVISSIETLGSFSLLLVALMIAGALQVLLGLLRAGRWISLVPGTVIRGMLVAIGLLLIIHQLPVGIGYSGGGGLLAFLTNNSPASSIITLVALGLLWLWTRTPIKSSKLSYFIPGPLVAVIWGSLAVAVGDKLMPESFESVPRIMLPKFETIYAFGEQFSRPDWQGAWRNPSVYLIALTLALVASLETLLSQEALTKLKPQKPSPSPNMELCAQGFGNVLSGFCGGLPITAVIVRSSVNVNAGARSKASIFLHGILLLLSGLLLSNLLNTIPLASLAAVLMYTGYKLAPPIVFRMQWQQGLSQFTPFIITVGGIIIFGMLSGIAMGLMAQVICSTYKSHRNALQLSCYGDHYVVRFHQNLTFLHKPQLDRLLAKLPDNCVVIADADGADYIDPDVKDVLDDFGASATERGIRLSSWPV